jgi:hypothetical protein
MRFLAAIAAIALSTPVAAQESPTLVVSAGASGFWHHNSHVTQTVSIASIEYRGTYDLYRGVKPLVGAFIGSDDSSYVHAGVYRDFTLSSRWILTPHFSAGAYSNGEKNNLGGKLEFQSGVDLFYRLDHRWRIGATLRHVSNGGIYDVNPGIETLAIVVSIPMR